MNDDVTQNKMPDKNSSRNDTEPNADNKESIRTSPELFLSRKLGKKEEKTAVRDPLFSAKILEREETAIKDLPSKDIKVGDSDNDGANSAQSKDESVASKSIANTNEPEAVPRLRTYQNDVSQALKNQKTTVAQMVLAEQNKRRAIKTNSSPLAKKNLPFVLVSTVLITSGALLLVGGAGYFLYMSDKKPFIEPKLEIPSIIFAEESKEIDTTDKSGGAVLASVANEVKDVDIRLDFIEHIYFTKKVPLSSGGLSEGETVRTLATSKQFFNILQLNAPDTLLRSLDDEFMFGVHSFNGNQPFIILKTNFFENAFAGLLNWEQYMARDLLPLFGDSPPNSLFAGSKFRDVIIKNKDFRVLSDDDGNIALLYAFFDRSTIIIATAEETLNEVVGRLNNRMMSK